MTIVNSAYCRDCGKEISSNALACPHCGAQQLSKLISGPKSRIVAALLALLVGYFGIHKFYLNQMAQGILYLVFSWTCIPLFISIIEFIIYLTMTDDEFARKYN